MTSRTCTKCKTEKPLDAFYKDKTSPDGYKKTCKACKKAYQLTIVGRHNSKQCFVAKQYLPVKHPLHVAGARFRSWNELYAHWRKVADLGSESPFHAPELEVDGTGFIYIIYNPAFDGWYKIGRTDDGANRLRTYQTADPHRAYKVCYEVEFYDCREAENAVKAMLQDDDKVIIKNEWVMGSFDRIRNMINEVKREEVSSGHRDELNSQFDLVLCN